MAVAVAVAPVAVPSGRRRRPARGGRSGAGGAAHQLFVDHRVHQVHERVDLPPVGALPQRALHMGDRLGHPFRYLGRCRRRTADLGRGRLRAADLGRGRQRAADLGRRSGDGVFAPLQRDLEVGKKFVHLGRRPLPPANRRRRRVAVGADPAASVVGRGRQRSVVVDGTRQRRSRCGRQNGLVVKTTNVACTPWSRDSEIIRLEFPEYILFGQSVGYRIGGILVRPSGRVCESSLDKSNFKIYGNRF